LFHRRDGYKKEKVRRIPGAADEPRSVVEKWCFFSSSTNDGASEDRPRKMLTSSANQYLRPEYLTPLPTTVSLALYAFLSSSYAVIFANPTIYFLQFLCLYRDSTIYQKYASWIILNLRIYRAIF
jgi:hypothetical protein